MPLRAQGVFRQLYELGKEIVRTLRSFNALTGTGGIPTQPVPLAAGPGCLVSMPLRAQGVFRHHERNNALHRDGFQCPYGHRGYSDHAVHVRHQRGGTRQFQCPYGHRGYSDIATVERIGRNELVSMPLRAQGVFRPTAGLV